MRALRFHGSHLPYLRKGGGWFLLFMDTRECAPGEGILWFPLGCFPVITAYMLMHTGEGFFIGCGCIPCLQEDDALIAYILPMSVLPYMDAGVRSGPCVREWGGGYMVTVPPLLHTLPCSLGLSPLGSSLGFLF
jgi:hypothetical protein